MTIALTNVQARVQGDDVRRHTQRRRRNVEVRRVAIVHPGGAHFKLIAVPVPLAATGG